MGRGTRRTAESVRFPAGPHRAPPATPTRVQLSEDGRVRSASPRLSLCQSGVRYSVAFQVQPFPPLNPFIRNFYLYLGLVWEPQFPKGFLFSQGKLVHFPMEK
jgi:hypothetical protein